MIRRWQRGAVAKWSAASRLAGRRSMMAVGWVTWVPALRTAAGRPDAVGPKPFRKEIIKKGAGQSVFVFDIVVLLRKLCGY